MKTRRTSFSLRNHWPRTAVPAVALTVLTGCAGSPDAGGPDPTAPVSEPSAKESDSAGDYTFRLPIAKYSYTESQIAVINSAQDALTERCMQRFGISYRVPEPPRQSRDSDRRYGLSSASDATHYGYHLPPSPSYNPDQGLDAEQIEVLYGERGGKNTPSPNPDQHHGKIPVNGCRGEAVRTLSAGHEYNTGAKVASDIANRSYRESADDSRVRDAVSRWSSCMKSHGFTYSSPLAALEGASLDDPKVTRREIETAEADMRCKSATNLLDIWFSVETSIQKAEIAKQSKVLNKLSEVHSLKVAAARKIVAES